MSITRVQARNNELYRLQEIHNRDQRHAERVQDEARVKHQHEVDEAKRIEMNRRLNRPGQNVDRMA
jgi:hypothetical protein